MEITAHQKISNFKFQISNFQFLNSAFFHLFIYLLICLFAYLHISSPSFAQTNPSPTPESNTSFGIANYLPINDSDIHDGDLISFSPKGYFKSNIDYDPFAVGVITFHPAISIQVIGENRMYAVVSTGDTNVNVTTLNGNIKKGDPITTSSIAGAGMKSLKSGYIVGVALDNYSNRNKRQLKAIPVRLNLHYYVTQSSLNVGFLDVLNLSTLATYEEPLKAFQYLIASVVVIISFLMSFFLFARTANKGIEALGRNPLASRTIQIGIVLNVTIAISIVLAGLIIAFIVLRL